MRFAQSAWLLGTLTAVAVAVLLIGGGILLLRAMRRFGDDEQMAALVTDRSGPRRAAKGALLVLAVALSFLALAQPQYGKGTRLIPATNLDVILVLDYSKSMYARDIAPSRIERAKSEVGRLIRKLPGARFGAVAFAGEPMAFPLTSDGSAIAQFFRQLSPHDMPVGGTAIARALEAGRELLERDKLAAKHKRVMVLVTDGEDLEGDPVSVAEAAGSEGITIHVVQIGGRSPEPIPDLDESGRTIGWRTDDQGNPLTTSLTAEGEAQLGKTASVTGGSVVRSQAGSTGIDTIAEALRRMMTEELSEKVETVYADVYQYPLGLAILLVVVETFLSQAPKRRSRGQRPPKRPDGQAEPRRWLLSTLVLLAATLGCDALADRAFERHAPAVDQALGAFDAGDASAAVGLLQEYLSTGKCKEGQIGTPGTVQKKPHASFDLGLGLFAIAEQFGQRLTEMTAESAAAQGEQAAPSPEREAQIDCALSIVELVANDPSVPAELRAKAHYLAGNLRFLRHQYQEAVSAYDRALRITPGLAGDAGDSIGRDAAWNRAIALRILDQQPPPDAGADGGPPDGGEDSGPPEAGPPDSGPPDAGEDAGPDAGDDGGDQQPDGGDQEPDAGDQGADSGAPDPGDAGADGGPKEQPPPPEQQSGASQDERVLDLLEQAPTLQEHNAQQRAAQRRFRSTEDK